MNCTGKAWLQESSYQMVSKSIAARQGYVKWYNDSFNKKHSDCYLTVAQINRFTLSKFKRLKYIQYML